MSYKKYMFWDDTRAVSPLIGFILLFGFLILGLSLYQATIIPNDNTQTEFIHNQEVQNDLIDLRDATHNSGLDTISRSTSVSLGTYYKSRIITINPVSPVGTLSTVDPKKDISVEPNSNTESTTWNFSTQYIQYEPQYREYQDPPTTTIEHSLIYNTFESANTNLTLSGQRMIEPDRLVIPIIEGDVSATDIDSVSFHVIYREQETVSISDNVTVTVPTRVPQLWEDEVAAEGIDNVTISSTDTTVEIEADVSEVILYRIELSENMAQTPDDIISDETQ